MVLEENARALVRDESLRALVLEKTFYEKVSEQIAQYIGLFTNDPKLFIG